jgi:GNAT superfamily N-acetyltransferase
VSVAIRPANRDDLDSVIAINSASAQAAYGHIFGTAPFPTERVRERYRRLLEDTAAHVFLAEWEGAAVGFVVVRPQHLEALYVSPAAWGRGVGSRLYEAAEPLLRNDATLWVLAANTRGREFWRRRGWRADRGRKIEHEQVELRYRRCR